MSSPGQIGGSPGPPPSLRPRLPEPEDGPKYFSEPLLNLHRSWLVFSSELSRFCTMLYDRPYMRSDYPGEKTPFLVWLLSATIAGFILQNIFAVWIGPSVVDFESLAALTVAGIRH